MGAAAGGSLGYVTAGLTGAAVGAGVGALAGLGVGAVAIGLSRPAYWYPVSYPYYGYYYRPVYYVGATCVLHYCGLVAHTSFTEPSGSKQQDIF